MILGVVLLAFALIVSYFLSLFLTKSIIEPIKELNDALQDTKDLTVRVEVNRNDEIGELAEKFNNYIEQLSKTIQQIASSSLNFQRTQQN